MSDTKTSTVAATANPVSSANPVAESPLIAEKHVTPEQARKAVSPAEPATAERFTDAMPSKPIAPKQG